MTDFWGCTAARAMVIKVRIESMVNFILLRFFSLGFGIRWWDVEDEERGEDRRLYDSACRRIPGKVITCSTSSPPPRH